MANILLLSNSKYGELLDKIAKRLLQIGHSIMHSNNNYNHGLTTDENMEQMFEQADGVIILINASTAYSNFFKYELASVVGYFESMEDKFILPFVIDDAEIPEMLNNYLVKRVKSKDLDLIVDIVIESLAKIISRNKVKETKKKEEITRIENNSTEYIDDALKLLSKRESRNLKYANMWNAIGYISLALGVVFGVFNFEHNNISSEMLWYQYFYISAKGLVILVFLAASSRYAFILGKAYMNESLKNADRIHAISFGRFYLKSYGAKATWNELKEVFQHWNLDKNSYFTDLKSSEFDPKITKTIIELAKSLSLKNNVDKK